jgi:hypothetical protein
MKLLKAIFLLIVIFCSTLLAQDNKMNSISELIDEVRFQFAPDKRSAIFDITVKESDSSLILSGETSLPLAKEKLISKLKPLQIIVKDEIQVLPVKNLGENIFGIVNLSVSNIRIKPDDDKELTNQSLLGTCVRIFKKQSGYYLVQTPDDYIGWMDSDGLHPVNKSELDAWKKSDKIIVTKEFGFSYSSPNEYSQRVSDLAAGDILVLLGEENNFYKVKYPDDRIAFILKSNCEIFNNWVNKPNPTEADIISTAKLMIGIPYLWGGTSIKGMDCSGFTKTVYYLNRIVLPRDASQQVNTGVLVDTKNGFEICRPGDLFFFGTRATDSTKEKVTHVGIYLGNSKFIHASGRVKINSLDSSDSDFSAYRLKHFLRVKRILTSIDKNGVITVKNHKYYFGET